MDSLTEAVSHIYEKQVNAPVNIQRPRRDEAHLTDVAEVGLVPEMSLHVLVALLLEREPLPAALLRAEKGLQVVRVPHVPPELLHVAELLLTLAGLQVARELPLVDPHVFQAVLRAEMQVEPRLRRVGHVTLLTCESGIA